MDNRIELAEQKRDELLSKLEKVKGTPKEDEFNLQIQKLEGLIAHLKAELDK